MGPTYIRASPNLDWKLIEIEVAFLQKAKKKKKPSLDNVLPF